MNGYGKIGGIFFSHCATNLLMDIVLLGKNILIADLNGYEGENFIHDAVVCVVFLNNILL